METITNPHDKLFRETWSNKEVAQDFLTRYLPPSVVALLDFATLEIAKDSFVDEALREYFSDILYRINYGRAAGYVYLLFEHKSYPERWIHLQLLEYMLNIWRLFLKQQPKGRQDTRLPIILPLVLYHGEREWSLKTRFSAMFDVSADALAGYLPNFEYIVHDLTRYADDEIKGTVLSRVAMLLFKHIHDPDIFRKLPDIFALMQELLLTREHGLHTIEMLLRYVFNALEDITVTQLVTIAEHSLQGDMVMTLAEQLRREGWTNGLNQGINQGINQGLNQGYERGLIEAIELGVSLKFGDENALKIMPVIRTIHDVSRLQALKDALKQIRQLQELNAMIEA